MPERVRRVLVTAATAGTSARDTPVGGGVAVLEELLPHLAQRFEVTLLRPGARAAERASGAVRVLDLRLPILEGEPADLPLHLGARAYARFALQWEAALDRYLEDVEPRGSVVLANDVSEGPPFARLAERGFRQVVLYHVVVAAFFARRYLCGLDAGWAARGWRAAERLGLARLAPDVARLVWAKEGDATRCAEAIVPSEALGHELAHCHPTSGVAGRTTVVPWGVLGTPRPEARARRAQVLGELGVDPQRRVLLTLGRLSPEKRIELLLRALLRLERAADPSVDSLALVVAGAPAYMGGCAYGERLRREAARLRRVAVHFPGYVGEPAKWDILAAADLFVSTSSYEAYGLSVAQALASGTPTLATNHQGARAILTPETGWTVRPRVASVARGLREALASDREERSRAGRAWARDHPFERAARRVIERIGDPS